MTLARFLLLLWCFYQPLALANGYGLILTISDYAPPGKSGDDLEGVKHDYKHALNIMSKMGVPANNIVHLSDQQVTEQGIINAFEFYQKLNDNDDLVIYYSGHGRRWEDSKSATGCKEGLAAYDKKFDLESFRNMISDIASRVNSVTVLLDSCFSGGLEVANSRSVTNDELEAKGKGQCEPINVGASKFRGRANNSEDLASFLSQGRKEITVLTASDDREVSWTMPANSLGSVASYAWASCISNSEADRDQSGLITAAELKVCSQQKVNGLLPASKRQTMKLSGNEDAVMVAAPNVNSSQSFSITAAMDNIYASRNSRFQLQLQSKQSQYQIGKDDMQLKVNSAREGYLYVLVSGTINQDMCLLFPNQLSLDTGNRVGASIPYSLPNNSNWQIPVLGPKGKDRFLAIVTQQPLQLEQSLLSEGKCISDHKTISGFYHALMQANKAQGKQAYAAAQLWVTEYD